jgi:ELWxxDGT repeat protein
LFFLISLAISIPHRVTLASASAALIRDINPNGASNPASFLVIGSTLFFTADDGVHGRELWRRDGTAATTKMILDINPGITSAFEQQGSIADLTDLNGTLLFAADDGVHGRELWRSDGTAAGTVMVLDIASGANSSLLNELVAVGPTLFFEAEDGTHGAEIWKSNGTAAGTVLLKDITPNDNGYTHMTRALANVNGRLYFTGDDGTTDGELWTSDGTVAGTVMVKDINMTGSSSPFSYTPVGSTVFFTAEDATHGRELWKTNGTAAGTILVKDILPSSALNVLSSRPHDLIAYKGRLYFFVESDQQSFGPLWQSDGTEAGTVQVTSLSDGPNPYPGGMVNLNNLLIFTAQTPTSGWELWRTDGTGGGTFILKDIVSGPQSAFGGTYYNSQRALANTLFFSPDDGIHGSELWTSDGTPSGTTLFQDIAPGSAPSTPDGYVSVNGQVLFTADDGTSGRELWGLPLVIRYRLYLPPILRSS